VWNGRQVAIVQFALPAQKFAAKLDQCGMQKSRVHWLLLSLLRNRFQEAQLRPLPK
jgi:hypothetical protein